MNTPPALEFSHVGIFVTDLDGMRDFYTRVLGFQVTDVGDLGAIQLVFLSRDPREHHQIVLATGRPAELSFNVVNQISLRAGSLADLRSFYRILSGENAAELVAVTHGIAWSIYCKDPEGNRIEIFVDSPWYIAQPVREPLDLSLSDDRILADTEARVKGEPSFRPMADWRAELADRLAAGRSDA